MFRGQQKNVYMYDSRSRIPEVAIHTDNALTQISLLYPHDIFNNTVQYHSQSL